jgi:hypothetical protein
MLGDDPKKNYDSIAQFSKKDAEAYPKYEAFLSQVREIVSPILDGPPPNPFAGKWMERKRSMQQLWTLARVAMKNRNAVVPFYELFTAPASHILDRWFEVSRPLQLCSVALQLFVCAYARLLIVCAILLGPIVLLLCCTPFIERCVENDTRYRRRYWCIRITETFGFGVRSVASRDG